MADFDSQLPVRTIATEFTTEIANSSGTTINPVEEFAQGSTTSGQKGPLDQGAVTTAAPTYVTGTTQPLSLDTTGNLRVAGTFTPSGLQNVNVTQWDSIALGAPSAYGTGPGAVNVIGVNAFITNTVPVTGTFWQATQPISAVSLPLPTGASTEATLLAAKLDLDKFTFTATRLLVDGSGVTQPVSGSVSVSNFPAYTQGSTTSGELGGLSMGAVTTAAPTYTTGQSDPLSLTTAGELRVAVTSIVPASVFAEVLTYNTAASIAANASSTQTFTPGTNVYLEGVDASASGQMKIEIQIGAVTKTVMFTSKGNLQLMWRLQNPILVTSGTAITVIRTNMDNQAMDVYSNIQTHV
jgi:hypothetical protein